MKLHFSRGQFLVFDAAIAAPACVWEPEHLGQGFASRVEAACFKTIASFGGADVTVHIGPYTPLESHLRVIEIPFRVLSGRVVICGPEEFSADDTVDLEKGAYRLTTAQAQPEAERETIDIYFDKVSTPISESRILRADADLRPPAQLLETAQFASWRDAFPKVADSRRQGIKVDPTIFVRPREREEAVVANASTAEVTKTLIAYFENLSLLPDCYVDSQELEYAGYAVGKGEHSGVDAAVDAWLAADAVPQRLSIAGWFLWGYWGYCDSAGPSLIPRLLESVDRLAVGSDSYVAVLYALLAAHGLASVPDDLKSRIRQLLLNELTKLETTGAAKGLEGLVYNLSALRTTR